MASEQTGGQKSCSRCGRSMSAEARVCSYCGGAAPTESAPSTTADSIADAPPIAESSAEIEPSTQEPFQVNGPSLPLSSAYGGKQPDSPPPPPPTFPAPGQPHRPAVGPQGQQPQFRNAPFWPRAAALIIDGLLLTMPYGLLLLATFSLLGAELDIESERFWTVMQLAQMPMAVLQIAYFTLMNGTYGATLGKMLVGLRIVRADGTPIGYGVALGRAVMQLLLSNCTCSLFYLSVAINAEHRGWHDQIVGTRVIYVK